MELIILVLAQNVDIVAFSENVSRELTMSKLLYVFAVVRDLKLCILSVELRTEMSKSPDSTIG